jgi:hypothetical protein
MTCVLPRIVSLVSPRDDGGELLVTRDDCLNIIIVGYSSSFTVRLDDIREFLIDAGSIWSFTISNQTKVAINIYNVDYSLNWIVGSGETLILSLNDFLSDQYLWGDVFFYFMDQKQEELVSGVNIRTINGETILGTGDITVASATYTAGVGLILIGTEFQNIDRGSDAVTTHEGTYNHVDIAHANRAELDLVSGTNTGDQVSGDFDHNALMNYVADEHIDWTGATDEFVTTEDAYSRDFVSVNSGAITRNVDGFVTQVAITGGRTITITRDGDGFIDSITDGLYTWTYTRNVDNEITSWSVA